MSENEVLSKITEGEIFGVVECDIHVPEGKKDKFLKCVQFSKMLTFLLKP
jgi:hypothetical protein